MKLINLSDLLKYHGEYKPYMRYRNRTRYLIQCVIRTNAPNSMKTPMVAIKNKAEIPPFDAREGTLWMG